MNASKGFVKIKVEVPKEVVTEGGIILPIEQGHGYAGARNYKEQKYAPTHGVVVSVGGDYGLAEGDVVMFHYNTESICKQQGRVEMDGDDKYLYVEIGNIVCYMRDGKIKPINGWLLARHCEKPKDKTDGGLYIPEMAQKKSDRKFVVEAVPDNYDEVLVGQIIYTEENCDRPVQSNEYFGIVDNELFKIETRHILAVQLA
jgi:co-chaperonin GroES (HSP10)